MASCNFNLANIKQKMYFIGAAGLLANYAKITDSEGLILPNNNNYGFNYGLFVGPEVEFFLHEKIVINSYFRQAFYLSSFLNSS